MRSPAAEAPPGARRAGRLCVLLAALALSLPALAPEAPAAPARKGGAPGTKVSGAERDAVLARFRERQESFKAFRATLVQRRKGPALANEAVTEGRFLFEKPDRYRWEARMPDHRIVASDGRVLTIYYPERREAERRDARDPFASRMAMEFMSSAMSQPLSELEKQFQVELSRRDGLFDVTLTPRGGLLAKAIRTITITQAEDDALPSRVVILGPKGDRMETVLSKVVLDPPVPADAFRPKLGPKVKVFDAIERKERGEDAP